MSSSLVQHPSLAGEASTESPGLAANAGIDVRRLSHRYIGRERVLEALLPIDLHIAAGEFVAVLGPSGCGKTTLLRLVGGLLEPSAGRVQLAGESPAAARRRRSIGWLAQEDGLLPWRRVVDNVGLPVRLAGQDGQTPALELLSRVGLGDSARRYPHELSGGMRQRAALARALVARPPFLLLDEPFAHLDEITRERLGDVLLELRTALEPRPPTTLLVTHSVSEALRLADRIVVMSARPGRVVSDTRVPLPRPRAEDYPAFGPLVRHLKDLLL